MFQSLWELACSGAYGRMITRVITCSGAYGNCGPGLLKYVGFLILFSREVWSESLCVLFLFLKFFAIHFSPSANFSSITQLSLNSIPAPTEAESALYLGISQSVVTYFHDLYMTNWACSLYFWTQISWQPS